MHDIRQVRQYLTDESAISVANALVSSCLDYCITRFRSLPSLNMRKLQCIRNTLARIVTNCNKYIRSSPFIKQLHWPQMNFAASSKLSLLFTSFFTVVNPVTLVLFCFLVVEGIVQDTTVHIKGSCRFPQFYSLVHE